MIELTKNNFIENGRCQYIDDYGNEIIFSRKDNYSGFWCRLKFYDERVTAKKIVVNFPVNDLNGGNTLDLSYPKGTNLQSPDIMSGINNLSELISRWVDMLYAIKRLEMKNEWLMKEYPRMTEEQVSNWKIESIEKFEELNGILDFIK